MAEFISNSAILTAIQPQHCAYGHSLDRPKVRKMADFTAKSAIRCDVLATLLPRPNADQPVCQWITGPAKKAWSTGLVLAWDLDLQTSVDSHPRETLGSEDRYGYNQGEGVVEVHRRGPKALHQCPDRKARRDDLVDILWPVRTILQLA